MRFVRLNGQTSGAAETVAYGLRALSPTERARPTVLLDGDTVYHGVDVLQRFRDACCTSDARGAATATPPKGASSRGVGAVFVFHDDKRDAGHKQVASGALQSSLLRALKPCRRGRTAFACQAAAGGEGLLRAHGVMG